MTSRLEQVRICLGFVGEYQSQECGSEEGDGRDEEECWQDQGLGERSSLRSGVVIVASVDFMVELPGRDPTRSGVFGRNLVSKIVNVDFLKIVLGPFS